MTTHAKPGVEVQCITCKAVKVIGREEANRLPLCDTCHMPMLARRASL